MINRKTQACHFCKEEVPAGDGRMWNFRGRSYVAHNGCQSTKRKRGGRGRGGIVTFHSPVTGWTGTQNANGRCEDAPCCGCCTC